MDSLEVTLPAENIFSQSEMIKNPTHQDESANSPAGENEHKLIPRHQNKMIAETTTDMFMSGLMCE